MVAVRECGGFTLAELLVATAVTIVALGLAVSLLHPVTAAFQSLPEASDAQQRLRTAVHTLSDEIAGAGAGPVSGWAARAVPAWPAVLPCRSAGEPLGARPDGCAQPDAITLMTTPLAAPQAVLADDLAAADGPFRLAALSACALSHPACRFHADARVLIADGSGAWDVAPLSAVSADGLSLEHAGTPIGRLYRAGTLVGEVASSSYNRRLDLVTGVAQLRRSVDGSADLPLVDHVTDLRFEYFGRADPPAVFDDGDALRRRTSYGPLPPPGGIDDTLDAWPPGESCHFIRAGGQAMPRQVAMPAGPDGLARLPLESFADGPWCPDADSVNRYDADLLRIRLVRIVLRVQAQSPAVRGHDAWLFAQPGGARESSRLVPDLEVRTDVAVRNR